MANKLREFRIEITAGETEKRKMFAAAIKLLIDEAQMMGPHIKFEHTIPHFNAEDQLNAQAISDLSKLNQKLAYTMKIYQIDKIDDELWNLIRNIKDQVQSIYVQS